MGKNHLGEFEEIVMLTVAILHGEAYGVAIIEEMENRLDRTVSVGSLQVVLKRLEQKGYVKSAFGEATKIRGGKRKRFFTLTNLGKNLLKTSKEQRLSLWDAAPDYALKAISI